MRRSRCLFDLGFGTRANDSERHGQDQKVQHIQELDGELSPGETASGNRDRIVSPSQLAWSKIPTRGEGILRIWGARLAEAPTKRVVVQPRRGVPGVSHKSVATLELAP